MRLHFFDPTTKLNTQSKVKFMESNKRKKHQDIYSTDHSEKDIYTPHYSSNVAQERKRDIRRQKRINFALGLTALSLSIGLVYIIINSYIKSSNETAPLSSFGNEYIPRYALQGESQWVLDFDHNFAATKWDGEGERPINRLWTKKAAYNIILAEKAYELEQFATAATHFENAFEIMPMLEDIRVPLGMCYFQIEKFDQAIELFEGIDVELLTENVLNNLGAVCIQSQVYELAEKYLLAAEEKNPVNPALLKNLGLLYQKTDQPEKSITYYERYFFQRPTDTNSRYDYALFLTKIAKWKEASEQLNLLTTEITDISNLYNLQARVELKLGNTEKALLATRRASQLTDPKNALNWMSDSEFDQLREIDDFQDLIKYRAN